MSNANSYELAMLDLINDERAAAGLEPLRLITTLNDAAETHSQWMLDADVFSHSGDGGSSPSDRMAEAGYPFEGSYLSAENIGWQSLRGEEGISDDVAQVHASLMDSPGHRANILSASAEDIGIGIETGVFTGQGGDFDAVMVTQVFGATDADISAWVDPGTGVSDDEMIVAEDDPAEEPVNDEVIDDEPVDEAPEDDATDEPDEYAADDTEDDDAGDDVGEGDDADLNDDDMGEDDPEEDEIVEDESPEPEDVDDEGDDEDGDEADDDPEDDDVPDDDLPEDDDLAMDDAPVCEGMPVLPPELAQFTVDLREAFTFTREGDQMIWETSEDRLVEVFLSAVEDWAEIPPEEGTVDETADITDLMLDEVPEDAMLMACGSDDVDDYLTECV